MIDFPTNPAVDTVVTAPSGTSWKWDGTTWVLVASATTGASGASKAYVDQQDNLRVLRAGDTMTGNLTVPNALASAAQSGSVNALTRKDYVDYQVNRANWNTAWGRIGVSANYGGDIGNGGAAGTYPMIVCTASPFTEGRRVRVTYTFVYAVGTSPMDPQCSLFRGTGVGGTMIGIVPQRATATNIAMSMQITADDVMTGGNVYWTFAINSVVNIPLLIYGTNSWTNQMTVDDLGPVTKR